MASSRALLLFATVALAMVCLTAAVEHVAVTDAKPPPKPPARPPKITALEEVAEGEVVEEETGGFSAMYYGILVSFAIFWTVYFFLYFFEYGTAGDYYFWASSYGTLVFLIALGLSKYFTASILTAVLAMTLIFIPIASAGFLAMQSISSPDRFQGDKNNMGRTRLESGM
mmetsp:Transcript_105416/g.169669  ORF Transcript_105416/g.169669 Transcript_105416/m.169669 type:complete len:170 (+) Transcript_105416:53-562(+)